MKEILFGGILIGLGSLLTIVGYRIARFLIPLWGFIVGFTMGAAGVSDAMNSSFIGTTLGIVVGLVVGLVFALLAYFFFSLAVVLFGATFGYWIGTGLMSVIGIEGGFLAATIGIATGVVLAIIFIAVNAPKVYLIVLSAFAGASAIVGGILLILNRIELESLSYQAAINQVSLPWFWLLIVGVLAVLSIAYQAVANSGQEIDKWGTPFAEEPKKEV